eukprot:scpid52715/ scgid10677/ UNC93-like protein
MEVHGQPSILSDALGSCIRSRWRKGKGDFVHGHLRLTQDTELDAENNGDTELQNSDSKWSTHAGTDEGKRTSSHALTQTSSTAQSVDNARSRGDLNEAEKADAQIHARNSVIVMFAAGCVLNAFFGLASLESSINSDGGVGQMCVALSFFPSVISVTFLLPFLLRRIGAIALLRLSMIPCLGYVAAHFNVIPAVLLTMCGVWGVFVMMIGTSVTVLATCSAIDYASIYGVQAQPMISRFSSILYLGLVSAYVFGPAISSLVLHNPPSPPNNTTGSTSSTTECHRSSDGVILRERDKNVLLSVYLGLVMLGILLTFGLRKASSTSIKARLASSTASQQITATLRLVGNIDLLLLIPIFFGSGLQKGFFSADFTSFFITPCLGVAYVGYATATFGVTNLFITLLLPHVMKQVNTAVLVVMMAGLQCTVLLWLIFWSRTSNAPLLYSLAAVWGVSDATWNICTAVTVGIVFPRDQEAANSNFRVWQGLGFGMAAMYSQRIGKCLEQMKVKLAYTILYTVFAAVTFSILEARQRRLRALRDRRKNGTDTVELSPTPRLRAESADASS